MQRNISAVIVEKVFLKILINLGMKEFTLEKDLTSASSVLKNVLTNMLLMFTKALILVRNHFNARIVRRVLFRHVIYRSIREFTQEKNHINAKLVRKDSIK